MHRCRGGTGRFSENKTLVFSHFPLPPSARAPRNGPGDPPFGFASIARRQCRTYEAGATAAVGRVYVVQEMNEAFMSDSSMDRALNVLKVVQRKRLNASKRRPCEEADRCCSVGTNVCNVLTQLIRLVGSIHCGIKISTGRAVSRTSQGLNHHSGQTVKSPCT